MGSLCPAPPLNGDQHLTELEESLCSRPFFRRRGVSEGRGEVGGAFEQRLLNLGAGLVLNCHLNSGGHNWLRRQCSWRNRLRPSINSGRTAKGERPRDTGVCRAGTPPISSLVPGTFLFLFSKPERQPGSMENGPGLAGFDSDFVAAPEPG